MQEKPVGINCNACFETGENIIRERFDRESRTLLRFSALFLTGKDPAFCQKMNGSYYICRRAPASYREEVAA